MPFKIDKNKINKGLVSNPNPVKDSVEIRTVDGKVMDLFSRAKVPMLTLSPNQFSFPTSFLVMSVKQSDNFEKDPDTGWNKKNDGNKIKIEGTHTEVELADTDAATDTVNRGGSLKSVPVIRCIFNDDGSLATKLEAEYSTIKLVKPSVMLGFGGSNVDRIYLVADDVKEV